jgi:hypothetical protein
MSSTVPFAEFTLSAANGLRVTLTLLTWAYSGAATATGVVLGFVVPLPS